MRAFLSLVVFAASIFILSACPYRNQHDFPKLDEMVVLFTTDAYRNASDSGWIIPIHGWIYEPEQSRVRKEAVSEILKKRYNLTPTAQEQINFTRRINLFFADNERGKELGIEVGGVVHRSKESSPSGHFHLEINVDDTRVKAIAKGNRVNYKIELSKGDKRVFEGSSNLVPSTGVSVISDIDDTVKISEVADRARLLKNTFFLDYRPAPGMAELYRKWADQGMSFHYISSSPWQLYRPLDEFLDGAGFPKRSLVLKSVRFKDETLLNLFKKGTETKPPLIENIMKRYPQRTFVLVGDSGEQDPEVYGQIYRLHPDRIRKIYIRNVTGAKPDSERFQKAFQQVPKDRWVLFEHPGELGQIEAALARH